MQRLVGPFSGSVVTPTRVGAAVGAPTRGQARGPGWRRTSCGFYVPADTARTPEQRVVEASVVVPVGGGLTGWAALRWMGGRWFDGTTSGGSVETPVPVSVPGRRMRAQTGITPFEERLDDHDVVVHDGLRLTTASRSTDFEMRHASSLVEAVVVADMAAFSDLTALIEVRRYLAAHPGRHGVAQARAALALAHENSWSPMETRLRMAWRLAAGLPPPLVNAPVFDLDGRHLGTPDLLDLEAGLVVEFDGAGHLRRVQRVHDLGREDRLRDVGLFYLTVLGAHLHDEARLAERLQRARYTALVARSRRAWTVELPDWWSRTDTVARRRERRRRRGMAWPADEPLPPA